MTSLRPLVANHLGVDEGQLVAEARFVEDLDADAIDFAYMLMAIEDAFNVDIGVDLDDALFHGTYGRLEALVAEKCAAKEACGG